MSLVPLLAMGYLLVVFLIVVVSLFVNDAKRLGAALKSGDDSLRLMAYRAVGFWVLVVLALAAGVYIFVLMLR